MKNLYEFLKNFFKNSGHYVFGSILISKLSGFATSLVAINMMSPKDFGWVSIVNSISIIFLSLNGLGSHQILLRYGSVAKNQERKEQISTYLFYRGLFYEIFISLIFVITACFYLQNSVDIFSLVFFFWARIIGFYFFNHIQCYYRIKGDNRSFSKVMNTVNIVGFVLVVILSYYFGIKGYLIAIAVSPFFSLIWCLNVKFKHVRIKSLLKKQMWSFGLFSILTALLSDLLFTLDILLLGYYLDEVAVAQYRTVMLIPANIVFLSTTFTQSDYPILAKNYKNKFFLKNYIFSYYKLFLPLCMFIIIGSYFLSDVIIKLFFGVEYAHLDNLFMMCIVTFCLSMLGRNLFGNLLSAIGEMKFNTITSMVVILMLLVGSYFLVPYFGILGLIYSMLICITLNGLLLGAFFTFKMKQLHD